MIEAIFRPLGNEWPQKRSEYHNWGGFKASHQATLNLLERELDKLDAKNIVIQIDIEESKIRNDGWPRSDVQRGNFPGVILSFESKFGPLRYLTDVFNTWEKNLRAIALGLESLRRVDRYGISKRGEQYTGWKEIGSGIPMDSAPSFSTADEAMAWVCDLIDGTDDLPLNEGEEFDNWKDIYRIAAKFVHPDLGGDPEDFKKLQEAKKLIEAR